MKTITFYSYKGGVGRTLLLGHIARYLVGLGHKVAVLDFDFDAPGVPAIFGWNAYTDCEGGIVDLFLQYASDKPAFEIHHELKKLLKSPKDAIPSFKNHPKGELRILPAGNHRDGYWKTISTPEWYDLFCRPDNPHSIVEFMKDLLKPALEAEGFEYLLVDSRAGITHYGGVATMIADSVVVIFCPNSEASHALPYVAAGIRQEQVRRNLESKGRKSLGLYPQSANTLEVSLVISRIPPELEDTETVVKQWRKDIKIMFKGIHKITGVFTFHSDLQTHLDHRLRFPSDDWHESNNVVSLQIDVVRILSQLCPRRTRNKKQRATVEDDAAALWFDAYKQPLPVTHVLREFILIPEHGAMLNADDGSRNVAFRVETFLKFLNNFYDNFLPQSKVTDKAARQHEAQIITNKALLNSGRECGQAFGRALSAKLRAKNYSNNEAKIKEWCRFDTRAGFGRLEYVHPDKLTVHNLFLHNPKVTKHRDFTEFFRGYAEAVITQLVGKNIELKRAASSAQFEYELY